MSTPPRKILIAMDGSKHSDYAFDWYLKYFYKERDDVLIVYCAEHLGLTSAPVQSSDATAVARIVKEEEGDIANLVAQFQKKLQTAGSIKPLLQVVPFQEAYTKHPHAVAAIKGNVIRLSDSKPGEAIVRVSEENKVDMIITGTRGQGTIRRTLMGSVSQYIVHHAQIPVLVVRQ